MSDTQASLPSPYASILSWSQDKRPWQRDALRRIILSEPLDADAVKELAAICRAEHGIQPATGTPPTAIPLTDLHPPGGVDGTASVSLSRISGLHNVGRIPSDQEIVFGAAPGLTVIYGENGAGKSGYARVIKRACRARGTPQAIKPDAFGATPAGPAKARIVFRVGEVDTPIDWIDGGATDPRLGNIFVFDSFSAQVHVGEDGPACFKPRGLDVLPRLAKLCDDLKGVFQQEIEAESRKLSEVQQSWNRTGTTTVGRLVTSLSAKTDPATIDAIATFTDDDDKRLSEIVATLNADPKLKASATAAAATRIRTFAGSAQNRATSVDDTAIQSISEAIVESQATAKAATAAAGPELNDTDLPGTCNDAWRKLWDAAKAFSIENAYPGRQFPVTDADARCVLCQQPLNTDAIDRYARFMRFVADETRKQAEIARARVATLKYAVDELRPISVDATNIKADLAAEAPDLVDAVNAFAAIVDSRINHTKKCLNDCTWLDIPPLPSFPCAALLDLANKLDRRAMEELSAADPAAAATLAKERDELFDKKWLHSKKDEVKGQIVRHAYIMALIECQEDCASRAISDKAKELDNQHLTDAFCKAFEQERNELEFQTLPVSLSLARVSKGESHFAITIDGTKKSSSVEDIASEGEHRCIALAAFMAEMSLASHKSALVFDDPVSSLDHKRRNAIAIRLVKESSLRQVIIFTHDLAFVCDLDRAADDSSKNNFSYRQIERTGERPGYVLPHFSWQYKSDQQQLQEIRRLIANAVDIHKNQAESVYREAAQVIINRLRGACERVVEQTLLCGAVKRHDSQVLVSKTLGISAVTRNHWSDVHDVWKICSHLTDAHAAPFSGPKPVPTPAQFNTWLASIEQVLKEVRAARAPSVPEPKLADRSVPHA